jgi:hypothetical protein
MINTRRDGTVELTATSAEHLAELPLRCLTQEYPNKTGHSAESATDDVVASMRGLKWPRRMATTQARA